jgi:hypothetical protein
MSISVFITLRELRPKYRFAGGFKPHHAHRIFIIPDLYPKRLLHIFFSCTENPRTPSRAAVCSKFMYGADRDVNLAYCAARNNETSFVFATFCTIMRTPHLEGGPTGFQSHLGVGMHKGANPMRFWAHTAEKCALPPGPLVLELACLAPA